MDFKNVILLLLRYNLRNWKINKILWVYELIVVFSNYKFGGDPSNYYKYKFIKKRI